MNIIVSFSGRKDGNCDYECMSGWCRYRGDGIYSFFEKLSLADKIFFIIPMYCGNPSALYFMMNERCQDYFMQNESRYEKMLEKLYIIGVYGNAEDSPDFLNFFVRQYGFQNMKEHVLGLERHRYHQKMKDFLLDEDDVKETLIEFIGRDFTR